MRRSPFVVDIVDLRDGGSRTARVTAPVEWAVELSRALPDPALSAELDLQGVAGGIYVSGTAEVVVRHTCHRCLTEFDEAVEVRPVQLYRDRPDEDDEDYVVTGEELDLEPLLRDEVLLSLPLQPVCGPQCPGLGSVLETDLNTAESGSPFAVLRELLEPEE